MSPSTFSYHPFLDSNKGKCTVFEEFICATLKWGSSVADASVEDLQRYLTHLAYVSEMASTQRYDLQIHIEYDEEVRKQAEDYGWSVFGAVSNNLAVMYYGAVEDIEPESISPLENGPETKVSIKEEPISDSEPNDILVPEVKTTPLSKSRRVEVKLEEVEAIDIGGTLEHGDKGLKTDDVDFVPSPLDDHAEESNIENDNFRRSPRISAKRVRSTKKRKQCSPLSKVSKSRKLEIKPAGEQSPCREREEKTDFDQNHECPRCGKQFTSVKNRNVHMKIHSESNKTHRCTVCGKGFRMPYLLKQHMRVHSGEKPYSCTECDRQFPTASQLNHHRFTHADGPLPYQCDRCGKSFVSKTALIRHRRVHTGETPFKCQMCGKTFRVSHSLTMHIKKQHSDKLPYSCDICQKQFKDKNALENHGSVHSGVKEFVCEHCGKSFGCEKYLKRHCITHTDRPRPHKCDKCTRSFRQLNQLKMHQVVHNIAFRHLCSICGRIFTNSVGLKMHYETHTTEKPFACTQCPKRFGTQFKLDAHIKAHGFSRDCPHCGKTIKVPSQYWRHLDSHQDKSERLASRHVCQQCGKDFHYKETLDRHMLNVHSAVKPFPCTLCTKSFGYEKALQEHMTNHTGLKTHQCDQCEKSFQSAKYLRRHQVVHATARPCICPTCGKSFKSNHHLGNHIKNLHTDREKNFKCTYPNCDKAYAVECLLKKHVRLHEMYPFQCNECARWFKTAPVLELHKKLHTEGKKNLSCPQCGRVFTHMQRLKRHINTVHKDQDIMNVLQSNDFIANTSSDETAVIDGPILADETSVIEETVIAQETISIENFKIPSGNILIQHVLIPAPITEHT